MHGLVLIAEMGMRHEGRRDAPSHHHQPDQTGLITDQDPDSAHAFHPDRDECRELWNGQP